MKVASVKITKYIFVLHSYVQGVVEFYYVSDADVMLDSELQKWIGEVFTHGFLKKKETGAAPLLSKSFFKRWQCF